MTISFKPPIPVTVYTKTPEDKLIVCTECGGPNAAGVTSQDLDCQTCDLTGYLNYWTATNIVAYTKRRPIKRWNPTVGGFTIVGDAQIKMAATYEPLIDSASHLKVQGIDYEFSRLETRGGNFGPARLVLALYRKG